MPENDIIRNPERLAALRATGLMDAPADRTLSQLARVAAKVMDAKVALVSLVDRDRQCFPATAGPGADTLPADRQTPLSHSFCKHAVVSREPLVVEDAREHPLVADNPAIADLGVVAYAGIPLVTADGHAIGTLCVIDSQPRRWSAEQIELLSSLADAAMGAVETCTAAGRAAAPPPTRPVAGADSDGSLATAAPLAEAVTAYFHSLDAYDACIRAPGPTPSALQDEERLLAEVAAAGDRVRTAIRTFPRVEGSAGGAATALKDATETYLETEARRSRLVEAFQQGRAGLADAEAAFADVAEAEQALRFALRTYELQVE